MELRARRALAIDVRFTRATLLDRKERRTRLAIQHEHVTVLGDLRHRRHAAATARDGDEIRRRREIPVPDVVLDALEMPHALAGARVEREHAVGKEVVAVAVHTVEIEGSGSGRGEHHGVRLIDRHARPRVGAAAQLIRLGGPRVVAELARLRNGVEDPAQLAGHHVEGTDVSRRSGQRFGHAAAEDQHVFEDRARCAGAHGHAIDGLAEPLAEIDAATGAERVDRLSSLPIDRPQEIAIGHEDAIVVDGDAAMAEPGARPAAAGRIEPPAFAARRGIDRGHLQRRRRHIERPVNDDGIALHLGALEVIAGFVGPRHLQAIDVAAVDLIERREADVVAPAVHRPAGVRRLRRTQSDDEHGRSRGDQV